MPPSEAQAEGAVLLGRLQFVAYKSAPDDGELADVQIVDPQGQRGGRLGEAVDDGARTAEAVCAARDLVNEPGGVLHRPEFAARQRRWRPPVARRALHDEKAVARLGFGGLLAVNRGVHGAAPLRGARLRPAPGRPVDADGGLVRQGIAFDPANSRSRPPRA